MRNLLGFPSSVFVYWEGSDTRRNEGLGAYSSVSGFILGFCCLETSVGYKAWAEEDISEIVHGMLLSLIHYLSLVSQTHFCKRREGSGELRIQAVSHRTVQCGTITLQYFVT